jgi:hypothetical protein
MAAVVKLAARSVAFVNKMFFNIAICILRLAGDEMMTAD